MAKSEPSILSAEQGSICSSTAVTCPNRGPSPVFGWTGRHCFAVAARCCISSRRFSRWSGPAAAAAAACRCGGSSSTGGWRMASAGRVAPPLHVDSLWFQLNQNLHYNWIRFICGMNITCLSSTLPVLTYLLYSKGKIYNLKVKFIIYSKGKIYNVIRVNWQLTAASF